MGRTGFRTSAWLRTRFARLPQAARGGYTMVLSEERKRLLIHAGRTTVAASLCWWLAMRFGLHDGYWGSISAIIVLQSNVGSTIEAARDRILGTIIGAGFGFSFSLIGHIPWNYIAAVFLAVMMCGLIGFRNSSRLAGVTVTIVMLVQSGSPKSVALDRVIQVVLGIMVALAVTILIFPRHGRAASSDARKLQAAEGHERPADSAE